MALTIQWLNKIDGLDLGDPQKNVNASDMNEIKTVTNTNAGTLDIVAGDLASHTANTSNPHSVTKTQVGLSNVDNTSDAGKPVSTAQAAAIAVVQNDINTHEALTNNPHGVTKAQVGLSNVDNTADTAKPVSAAQQTELDLKLTKTDDVWGEVPSGTVDGVNDDFTIANSNPSKVALYLDGIRTNPSNFSITGTALTITNAGVIPTNSILIDYIK